MRFSVLSATFIGLSAVGLAAPAPDPAAEPAGVVAPPAGDIPPPGETVAPVDTIILDKRVRWTNMGREQAAFIYGLSNYKLFNGLNSRVAADVWNQAVDWVRQTVFPGGNMDQYLDAYKRMHNWNLDFPSAAELEQAKQVIGMVD